MAQARLCSSRASASLPVLLLLPDSFPLPIVVVPLATVVAIYAVRCDDRPTRYLPSVYLYLWPLYLRPFICALVRPPLSLPIPFAFKHQRLALKLPNRTIQLGWFVRSLATYGSIVPLITIYQPDQISLSIQIAPSFPSIHV